METLKLKPIDQESPLHRYGIPFWLFVVSISAGCATSYDEPTSDASAKPASQRPAALSEISEAPNPASPSADPLAGARLFVDPDSLAMLQANAYRDSQPETAALLDRIAKQPQAIWMGGWNSDVFRAVDAYVGKAAAADTVPTLIIYNIPYRDCGQHSRGGLSSKEAYQRWVRDVYAGIGDRAAVVIVEPDALGHFQECLDDEKAAERMFLLKDAVKVLRQSDKIAVYLDAGHARWVDAEEMAERLKLAGVEYANGFSLNTSNYVSTEENLDYGKQLSALTEGKHFIIDTSRNGAGPYEDAKTEEETWCNPPGRKLGAAPTTDTGEPLCDGFLWLKRPGESDGQCRGGPQAGVFWLEQALEYASK